MFKKIFFVLLTLCCFTGTALSVELKKFRIFPDYLFTDDDVGVRFTVTVLSQDSEIKKNIVLLEVDESLGKIKYRWPLNDEGIQGDLKSGDGLYSRIIQFKEKRPKQLVFYVLEDETNKQGFVATETLPSVSAQQRATLEIRAHPTFIDVLKDVWKKIKEKF